MAAHLCPTACANDRFIMICGQSKRYTFLCYVLSLSHIFFRSLRCMEFFETNIKRDEKEEVYGLNVLRTSATYNTSFYISEDSLVLLRMLRTAEHVYCQFRGLLTIVIETLKKFTLVFIIVLDLSFPIINTRKTSYHIFSQHQQFRTLIKFKLNPLRNSPILTDHL